MEYTSGNDSHVLMQVFAHYSTIRKFSIFKVNPLTLLNNMNLKEKI